jgi:hypothetical protein
MHTKLVEQVVTIERRSKYAAAYRAMVGVLEADGADGKLRAVTETATWTRPTLRRWRFGLRDRARRYPVVGYKLRLRICVNNGLCFAWVNVGKRPNG